MLKYLFNLIYLRDEKYHLTNFYIVSSLISFNIIQYNFV